MDDNYHVEHAHVVALLEQDGSNKDILTGEVWGKAAELWSNNWMNGNASTREQLALLALVTTGAISDDDLLGMPRTVPQLFTTGGNGTVIVFQGESNSHYSTTTGTSPIPRAK